jgi:hypothetical protein
MEAWLDLVLSALNSELEAANASLQQRLTNLDESSATFYGSLSGDLAEVMVEMMLMETNLTEEGNATQADIEALSQLVDTLNNQSLSELRERLTELGVNLSDVDEGLSDKLLGIASDISDFENMTSEETDEIDQTLLDLEKLQEILADMEALDQDLAQAQTQIEGTVQDTGDEQISKSNTNMALIALVFVLVLIVLLLTFMMFKRPVAAPPPEPTSGEDIDVVLEELSD